MPMRPFTLLDLVGLEVADHVGQVLRDQLGERFHASPGLSAMAERKARFTERSKDSVHPPVSPTVAETFGAGRSEEHTSELQSRGHLVCRLLLEKKKDKIVAIN